MAKEEASKKRNVEVKKYRANYTVHRRIEGATLTEIAKELNVNPRTLTRDINDEYYTLIFEELIQQQLQTIKQLPPQDAWKARQKLLELIQPKTHHNQQQQQQQQQPKTTPTPTPTAITTSINPTNNNNNNNNINHSNSNLNSTIDLKPDSASQVLQQNQQQQQQQQQQQWQLQHTPNEGECYSIDKTAYFEEQMQDPKPQIYKQCHNYIESHTEELLKDITSQVYKNFQNILQTQITNLINITTAHEHNKNCNNQINTTTTLPNNNPCPTNNLTAASTALYT